MRKLIKGFLVVVAVILALAAAGMLAVNLYVQSAGTQKRIQQALSSGLKVPVHVSSTIVTPWSGLKASGIAVPQISPAPPGNFLEAASFTARFDWMALFKHRLEAGELSLDEPRVEWFQSPDGRWDFPRITAAATPRPSATPPGEIPHPVHPPWAISVHKLIVNGALFDFWDEKGFRVLEFSGVQFDCLNPSTAGSEGRASARNISLHDRLYLNDMHTNWSFQRGALRLFGFQTGVGGGEIQGDAQVATQARHSPFNVDVKFDQVNVNRLMIETGQPAGQVTGTLAGWLDIYGNPGKTSTINGSAHLELAGGRMQNIDLFQTLGAALQIPDLVELNLKTAQADARVVSGVVYVDKLLLESQNLMVAAHGKVGIDGKLGLDARLTINGAISSRLPSFILTYFKPGDTADSRYIDFGIGNTLAHPRTNLLENIMGHRIQGQMTDLFNTLFKKKHKEPTPAPTPP